MRERINISGQRFGKLVAIADVGQGSYKVRLWKCICDCGNTCVVIAGHLVSGDRKSCGCTKHSRQKRMTPDEKKLRERFKQMHQRCHNPKHKSWSYYGGRGITVCKRWHKFGNFIADMGMPPTGMTLDRINNDQPYSPSNCRWVSRLVQQHNTRRCHS